MTTRSGLAYKPHADIAMSDGEHDGGGAEPSMKPEDVIKMLMDDRHEREEHMKQLMSPLEKSHDREVREKASVMTKSESEAKPAKLTEQDTSKLTEQHLKE